MGSVCFGPRMVLKRWILAKIFLHEAQHCLAIMQSVHGTDNLKDSVNLQTPAQ